MKISVEERYVVAVENEGMLEAPLWCVSLKEAREIAGDMRSDVKDVVEKRTVLILKVLRI
jgi:hypothetical protein